MRQFIFITFFAFVVFFSKNEVLAQKKNLNIKSESVIKTFLSGNKNFQWAFPVSDNEQLLLVWESKDNSFSNEGIATFVGYQNQHFRAVASIKDDSFSAILTLPSREISLKTDTNGFLFVEDSKKASSHCTSCSHRSCQTSMPTSVVFHSNISEPVTPKIQEFTTDTHKGYADSVLRIYRLAMPITYEYFSTLFNHNIIDVHLFWAQMETALNEIFIRDISVKFEVVRDNKLIMESANDPINAPKYNRDAGEIIRNSTNAINELIGEDAYDIGIVIGKSSGLKENEDGVISGLLGLAGVGAAYSSAFKAQGIGVAGLKTIVHELGHMFGGEHTLSEFGGQPVDDSMKTEIGYGESAMSYGSPGDFFSLPSIGKNIKPILARMPYYTDRTRTNASGFPFYKDYFFYNNHSFGIKTTNKAPIINKNLIKSEYTIPQGTFFQFYIPATDSDGNTLSYMANPADIKTKHQHSNARFLTLPASENNWIGFQTMYEESRYDFPEMVIEKPHSTPSSQEGTYIFWLAVRDSDISLENHATAYDLVQTKVKVVSGKPFKFTNQFKNSYNAKDKILLKWSVDENIFPKTSKVRILLSDDFGKTFKYILSNTTENDGEHEVTLPNISINTIDINSETAKNSIQVPAGIIKIEVLGELAYDVSATRPYSVHQNYEHIQSTALGGFTLTASGIELQNTPEKEIFTTCFNIPEKASINAVSHKCSNSDIKIDFKEEGRKTHCASHTFTRTWTATDSCGNTDSFVQTIHITPELKFVGNLPKNMVVSCDAIPPAESLTAIGGCSDITISYTEESPEKNNCDANYEIIRTWVATDSCRNGISYTQTILVMPRVIAFNAVSLQKQSKNYLKFSGIKTGHLTIFDEMGLKVFESTNYGENGDIFRGYSNIKGSFIENKPVASGTYFYIFTYIDEKGETQHLKGFLFVG